MHVEHIIVDDDYIGSLAINPDEKKRLKNHELYKPVSKLPDVGIIEKGAIMDKRFLRKKRTSNSNIAKQAREDGSLSPWPTPEVLACQDYILKEEFKDRIKEVLPEILAELIRENTGGIRDVIENFRYMR